MSFTNDPAAAKEAEYRDEERAQYATPENIARVGYEAVAALEDTFGAPDYLSWNELAPERQADYIAGVNYIFDHPNAPVSAQHDAWLARNSHRLAPDDPRRKTYAELTYGQQVKAALWRHICHAFGG